MFLLQGDGVSFDNLPLPGNYLQRPPEGSFREVADRLTLLAWLLVIWQPLKKTVALQIATPPPCAETGNFCGNYFQEGAEGSFQEVTPSIKTYWYL